MTANGRSGPKKTPRYVYDLDTDIAVQGMNLIVRNLVAEIHRLRRELLAVRSNQPSKPNPAANVQVRSDDILYVSAWSFEGRPTSYSFYKTKRAHYACLRRMGLNPKYTYRGSGAIPLHDLLKDAPTRSGGSGGG